MTALAHSARPKKGIPAQSYADHINSTVTSALAYAAKAAKYYAEKDSGLVQIVGTAAPYHDLGKLLEENQMTLNSGSGRQALPINHVDAGVAALLMASSGDLRPAIVASSHHAGLPHLNAEVQRKTPFRDVRANIRERCNAALNALLVQHRELIGEMGAVSTEGVPPPPGLFLRIALSCLVDADHGDTARHYGNEKIAAPPHLMAQQRLEALDRYVAELAKERQDERSALRGEVYAACRNGAKSDPLMACGAAVGTGKTTAVMAYCLNAAIQKGLRRVFVVLPYTNIIDQAVRVYRKALVLPGEDPQTVIAAHHHRAEFQDPDSRGLAFLWRAPIVVVTAVQFFETLAANTPAALRKLHQLPGAAVFLDESHAALPIRLWPLAWQWLRELAEKWGCHIVLGSGSLTKFWELEEFNDEKQAPACVPEMLPPSLAGRVADKERARVRYVSENQPLAEAELWELVDKGLGPRLVIVNTVQSAAVLARQWAMRAGRLRIEHLSTALCPRDREKTLERVKSRLDSPDDTDWCLVATSCAEAGLDLSFGSGFRERAGLTNLLQIAGRVNREGGAHDAVVTDFCLRAEGLLRSHPGFETARRVLGSMLDEGKVDPSWCTEALRREIRENEALVKTVQELKKAEGAFDYPTVAEGFKVIATDTRTVLVDRDLIDRLQAWGKAEPKDFQALSVQLWAKRIDSLRLEELRRYPGVYAWSLDYDDFLGIMAGILTYEDYQQAGGGVV